MPIDLRELLPDVLQYKLTMLYVVLQFVLIAWWSRPSADALRAGVRSPSDASWFLPVYVWGLESLHHCPWWVFEAPFRGIVKTLYAFLPRFLVTDFMLVATICGCFLAEILAHRRGLAARTPQATLPLSVVAGIVGVHMTWSLFALLFVPMLP